MWGGILPPWLLSLWDQQNQCYTGVGQYQGERGNMESLDRLISVETILLPVPVLGSGYPMCLHVTVVGYEIIACWHGSREPGVGLTPGYSA